MESPENPKRRNTEPRADIEIRSKDINLMPIVVLNERK